MLQILNKSLNEHIMGRGIKVYVVDILTGSIFFWGGQTEGHQK